MKPAIKRLAKDVIRRLPIQLVGSYVRYSPIDFGKARLVAGYLDLELQRRPREFVARVKGGANVAGTTEGLVQRHIYEFGVWESDLTRWIHSRLRPGDVFVDVGANVGYFSLIGSRCVGPDGVVVAIEASPPMFELLRCNLRRNRLTNVRAVNVAASDAHGSLRIHEGLVWNRGQATTVGRYRTYKLEVDYTAASYVAKPLAGPIEWHGGFGEQADFIFSRGDPAAGAFQRASVRRRRLRAVRPRSRLTGKR